MNSNLFYFYINQCLLKTNNCAFNGQCSSEPVEYVSYDKR